MSYCRHARIPPRSQFPASDIEGVRVTGVWAVSLSVHSCNHQKMQFILALVCLAILGTVMGYHGVDVSQPASSSDFSCMKSNGYTFAVARVYCSSGHTDSNGPATITAAWNGGMSHVDGYIFPCYSCGNPAGQVRSNFPVRRYFHF